MALSNNSQNEFAKRYLSNGWNIIPLRPFDPKKKAECEAKGVKYVEPKMPLEGLDFDFFFKNRVTPVMVDNWFPPDSKNNLGIVTGLVSSLIVIDVDGEESKHYLETMLRDKFSDSLRLKFTETYVVKTGSGGLHFYLKFDRAEFPEGIKTIKLWIGEYNHSEIMIKGNAGQVVAPPSIHPSGNPYEGRGKEALLITKEEYDELVLHFKKLEREVKPIKQKGKINLTADKIEYLMAIVKKKYKEGNRDQVVFALSGFLRKAGVEEVNVKTFVKILCEKTGDDEVESRLKVVENTFKKDINEVVGFSGLEEIGYKRMELKDIQSILTPTITDMADMFDRKYTIRTFRDSKELLLYDEKEGIFTLKAETMLQQELQNEYPEITQHQVREVVEKLRQRHYIDREEFDKDPYWLHVANGWVHVLTREFKPHDPGLLSLVKLSVKFDPNAIPRNIIKFLREVLNRTDCNKYLRFMGYMLLRECKYESALMLIGEGANGKSTLIKLTKAFLGKDNIAGIDLHSLINERFMPAQLYGKLANFGADIGNAQLINTQVFKKLVSGDPMEVEKKGQDPFTLVNYAKFIFAANDIPKPRSDNGYAWYRRWCVLKFNRTFEGENRNVNLIHELTEEKEVSGLLNLALGGLQKLMAENGFSEDDIETTKNAMETGAKKFNAFISECCVLDNRYEINTATLQEEFRKYCDKLGSAYIDIAKFGEDILGLTDPQDGEKMITKGRRGSGKNRHNIYVGITLKRLLEEKQQTF